MIFDLKIKLKTSLDFEENKRAWERERQGKSEKERNKERWNSMNEFFLNPRKKGGVDKNVERSSAHSAAETESEQTVCMSVYLFLFV